MNVLKPHKRTTIFTLLGLGKSQRDIERITGIDRKTIRSYQRLYEAQRANSPGVATDPIDQIPPPWPPVGKPSSPVLAASKCEPHRAFIDAQLRLGRNAMAIYQDLVDRHGFDGAYNSVKRFAAGLRHKAPEQFDRLSFAPGEEMQVDYGEGAPTRVAGTNRYRKPRLFVATLRYSRRSFRCVVWKSSQQVWAQLRAIPYGETASYGEVAAALSDALADELRDPRVDVLKNIPPPPRPCPCDTDTAH